ncbi:hypothetical protein [Paenibacillus anseongense]|uniref:hypothetical protein n=1 Tax=Paenibacillus anseongense TaxID=2682845 RepID=UPI001FEC33FB|nr:hypothetical protein [Paenibacillus anseongense]
MGEQGGECKESREGEGDHHEEEAYPGARVAAFYRLYGLFAVLDVLGIRAGEPAKRGEF